MWVTFTEDSGARKKPTGESDEATNVTHSKPERDQGEDEGE